MRIHLHIYSYAIATATEHKTKQKGGSHTMSEKKTAFSVVLEIFTICMTVLPAFILFAWHATTYGEWLIDDAGISFAYARNMATGHGLVSQPGLPPVEGFSNPTWTFLLSGLYALDLLLIPSTPKIISLTLTYIGFFVFAATIRDLIKKSAGLIVAGGALILSAANPAFVIWSVSGLENPLMVCLGALLLLYCARLLISESQGSAINAVGGGIVGAALALTRPDGIIYAAAVPFALMLRSPNALSLTGNWKALGLYLTALSTPLTAYLAFRLCYFGDWLPNTYYAKPGTSLEGLVHLLMMSGDGVVKFELLANAILPCLPLALPLLLAANVFQYMANRQSAYPRFMYLLTILVCLGLSSYMLLPEDWMAEFRFGTLPILFFYALLLANIQWLLSDIEMKAVRATMLIAAFGLILSYSYFNFRFRAQRFAERPTAPLATVARAYRPLNDMAIQLGMPHASLLMPDLGATLMYSSLRVIDLAGLCDREIGRLTHRRAAPAEFSRYIIARHHPDFVHIHGWWAYISGLTKNTEFSATYINLGDGNYFRRASAPIGMGEKDIQILYTNIIFKLQATPETLPAHF
jgi:hypothetical protein